jgi:hypothetical protein
LDTSALQRGDGPGHVAAARCSRTDCHPPGRGLRGTSELRRNRHRPPLVTPPTPAPGATSRPSASRTIAAAASSSARSGCAANRATRAARLCRCLPELGPRAAATAFRRPGSALSATNSVPAGSGSTTLPGTVRVATPTSAAPRRHPGVRGQRPAAGRSPPGLRNRNAYRARQRGERLRLGWSHRLTGQAGADVAHERGVANLRLRKTSQKQAHAEQRG